MPYVDVNGVSLWYEEYGSADGAPLPPLVVLHGGFGSGEMFQPLIERGVGAGRRVLAVDLQGHGRTPDAAGREMSAEAMADDLAGLVKHLGLAAVDVLGYSLGAAAALRLAIQHPTLVRRAVLISVPVRNEDWYPEVRAQMELMSEESAGMLRQSPMYELYERIAPRVEDWPVVVGKVAEMIKRPYDWSGEIAGITAAVLLVFADADSVAPVRAAEFFALLGGGQGDPGPDGSGRPACQLAVLPGATHYDLMESPLLPAAVRGFLDGATTEA
ncbi:alpha/beta fold hydrolase [Streptomyces sp. NPDC090025]|uniref:alpha/beta fold hydrolase n=1 Tax=Streptomyces sp. NPDC090025 TaxID=3365922 RepID=UPI003833A313